MSYTNLDITRDRCQEDLEKKYIMLKHERDYISEQLQYAVNELQNLPEAINEYGYIDITYGNNQRMRLVLDKQLT